MKIGIVIAIHERPEYLKQCLESIKDVYMTEDEITFLLINDNSKNEETNTMFWDFKFDYDYKNVKVIKRYRSSECGIHHVLSDGFTDLYIKDFEIIGNIDSDAIVNKMWLIKLIDLQKKYPFAITSAFRPNHPLHKVVREKEDSYQMNNVAGMNIMFKRCNYSLIMEALSKKTLWDWELTKLMNKRMFPILVTKPCYAEHIGDVSTLGHGTGIKAFDFIG